MGITISKLKLTKINHELPASEWLTGIQMSLVEEVTDENGGFLYAKEKTVTFRNFFAHESLCEKFEQLRSHMALICEYAPGNKVKAAQLDNVAEIAPGIFVNQVILTGDDSEAGVMLGGFKVLGNNKQLNLITPNIKLDGDDYQFGDILFDLLHDIEVDAKAAYLQKRRKIVQGTLFEEDGSDGGSDDEGMVGDPTSIKGMVAKMKKDGITISAGRGN